MDNKSAGYIIIGISAVIGFIVWTFNQALTEIVSASCNHGTGCPMWGTISFQTKLSIGLISLVALGGVYLIFSEQIRKSLSAKNKKEPNETSTTQIKKEIVRVEEKDYTEILKNLSEDEKIIFQKIIDAKGTIFQSELVEQTELNKVKVTRLLDKLEGRDLVERKRRGMTNVVVLKH